MARTARDGVSDREEGTDSSFPHVADVGEKGLRGSGTVGADEEVGAVPVRVGDLRECLVEHRDVVAGGVGTGVSGTQPARQCLAGVGQEAQQRMEAEAALVGGYSAACSQATSRAWARAEASEASAVSSTSASSRQAVGVEVTGPKTVAWSRSTARSAMASPPSAGITARSVAIRPGSCPVPRGRSGLSAVECAAVSPVASARSASSRAPACPTTPEPSALTWNLGRDPIACT